MSQRTPILQFGTSRFLQAHFDLFVSEAQHDSPDVGAICVIQSSGEPARSHRLAALCAPDGFTVRVRGLSKGKTQDSTTQVKSIRRSLSTAHHWSEITQLACREAEYIVSNTGDTGFEPSPSDKSEQFKQSMSYPAKLLLLLVARFKAGARPIQIMPMELLANNGDALKQRVLNLASEHSAELISYLNNEVRWVNSLVDRIVSEPLEPAGAVAEPYALWAIENQPNLSLPCTHPCIQVVDNLQEVEALKLYILNLGHTAMAHQWLQAQDSTPDTVGQYLHCPDRLASLQALYAQEVLPAFIKAGLGSQAKEYVQITLDRFRNPFLEHKLADIAQNHQQKTVRRVQAFLQWAHENGDESAKPTLKEIVNESADTTPEART